MNPTNEHREQAREIIEKWKTEWSLEPRDDVNLGWRKLVDESLENRIASALLSRDAEVTAVLTKLADVTPPPGCWCGDRWRGEHALGSHADYCLAASDLYSKLQVPELQEEKGEASKND